MLGTPRAYFFLPRYPFEALQMGDISPPQVLIIVGETGSGKTTQIPSQSSILIGAVKSPVIQF